MMNRNILNPMMWTTEGPTPPPTKGGIFWSPSLRLISISSDDINWLTMSDSDLITPFYTSWQAPGYTPGYYHQWGNNYGCSKGRENGDTNKVDASNFGPYYESDTFITASLDRSSVQNDNLWGGETSDFRWATTRSEHPRQGPCSSGFHVPTKDENIALVNAMTALGIDTSNGNCMKTYMKMPFAGRRENSAAVVLYHGNVAAYWSSTASSANYAYYLYFGSTRFDPQADDVRSFGFSIRPFKNNPTTPTSSWVTLYDGGNGKGIFWSATDGLISLSSDGENWITIADKNLGATAVYSDGDELSEANCGKYYQRGNNYGFSWSGDVTTSSTQVDATNYGPYYYANYFIVTNDWSSVRNDNLRGGVTDTLEARRGPCSEGYHIPSKEEFEDLINKMIDIGININFDSNIKNYLKAPLDGYRAATGSGTGNEVRNAGQRSIYWTSTPANNNNAYCCYVGNTGGMSVYSSARYNGYSIRPFKNEPVVPDSTWTKLY